VSKNISDRRSAGKPRKRCLDSAQNDLKKIGARGRRKTTRDKEA